MKDIGKIKLKISSTIKEALTIIDSGAVKIALVVDDNDLLIGTLTDGDVRRGILSGKSLDENIANIYCKSPTTAKVDTTKEEIINLCTSKTIYQIPIVDNNGRVVSVDILDELLRPKNYESKVVLMVGGLGSRLRPLTENIPKPMLNVGGKPILQTIVEKFSKYGFVNFVMCVGYKSNIIQDFFGDGSSLGVSIEYILEEKRLGTAGALSLLLKKPDQPFFVMNGDLLTNINYEHLLDYHIDNKAEATMCVREYDFQVPYGVVNIDDSKIKSIVEKPLHKFFVNAGIYVLNPTCLDLIPKNEFYDMPSLFEKLISIQKNTLSFPLREYWLDIGRIEEYKKANEEYYEVFNV